MLRTQRAQIFAVAMLCGSLAAFSAYWMRGELVKQGVFNTEPRHIPCASEDFAKQIARELQSDEFKKAVLVPYFDLQDISIDAVADGKWVETKMKLYCWGRVSYSISRFTRDFDAADPDARARNQKLLVAYEKRMREIENKALLGM